MTEPNLPAHPPASGPDATPEPALTPPPPARRPAAPIQYKGEELDAARGPGLGCFYVQLVFLVGLLVVTPITVASGWPPIVSMALLVAIIVLLLFTGQTMIFLLRLVAADRGRRRPLASPTPTVGDLEAEETREPGREGEAEVAPDVAGERAGDRPAAGAPAANARAANGPVGNGPAERGSAGGSPEHGGGMRE